MIRLTARGPKPLKDQYKVLANGKELRRVVRVIALWNGGPGLVERDYIDLSGCLVLDHGSDRIATTWSVFRNVRVTLVKES